MGGNANTDEALLEKKCILGTLCPCRSTIVAQRIFLGTMSQIKISFSSSHALGSSSIYLRNESQS
eukprot:scaffold34490_cov47-Prasinocladus_malaysianus.AAC.1